MLFSTATGYALQTLAALPEDGGYHLARSLAKQLNLPGPYLAKILQSLVQAGILESVRGPKGGFRLAKPAHTVTGTMCCKDASWVSPNAAPRIPAPCIQPGARRSL
jgi:Rrf2 family protein